MNSPVIFDVELHESARQAGVNRGVDSWIKPYQEDPLMREVCGVMQEARA